MDRQKVKSGLGLMFWGNIVALFAVIPILGVFTNGNDGGMWSTAINLLRGLATLGATYYICTATEDCVRYVSYEVADYCRSVCNCYVICMVISLVIEVVMFVFSIIPLLGIIVTAVGAIALVVVAIFQLIASIRFLIMLWKCQGVL